jgi:hypothetical protein
VNALPSMDAIADQTLCANDATAAIAFTSSDSGVTFDWTNDDASINLATSGSGDIASFNTENTGSTAVTAVITVTPMANGCAGTPENFSIIVNPLPSVAFTPISTACVYDDAFSISASPTGGTFSGTGVTGTDFDPATAGVGVHTITYEYTDATTTCSASAMIDITVDACASIEENNVNNVAIFPNPATEVITLTFEADEALVTLYSIQGQVMSVNTIHSSEMINVSDLDAGTYIVKVQANNRTYTDRVIIK